MNGRKRPLTFPPHLRPKIDCDTRWRSGTRHSPLPASPCSPAGRPNGLVDVSYHGHGHWISPICRVCTQIPAPMETLLDYTCTRVHAYTCVYTCIVLWYEPLHVSRPWRERRPGSPLNPLTAKSRRTWKEVLPVSSKRAPRLG